MGARQLIAAGELPPAKVQPTRPCTDCPMARTALPCWLGMSTPSEYRALAHSDSIVMCHVHGNVQCAGMAIYRANVCKHVHPPGLRLPRDKAAVFATPMEFEAHHSMAGLREWSATVKRAPSTAECGNCGSTLADREAHAKRYPDEDIPTGLQACHFCGADKCALCDMGDDVSCASCEGDAE